jgi:hypothetical protein
MVCADRVSMASRAWATSGSTSFLRMAATRAASSTRLAASSLLSSTSRYLAQARSNLASASIRIGPSSNDL